MSERGQKIFKIITWIVLLVVIGVGIYASTTKNIYPLITKSDWINKLEDSCSIVK